MIQTTKPFLPPYSEYISYLDGIWSRNWLTNNGPLVRELELKLREYLGMDDLVYVSNGTIALQLALKSLGLKGEIITTPFSYVATTSSIVWEGCDPVFVDIDRGSFNIDPNKIPEAIGPRTTGILATHVFGNPCDVNAISRIAEEYQLKVIYDAAHAFGTRINGHSLFHYGDISVTSFHATKLFHTVEGGAVFTKDPELIRRLRLMRNFGHDGPERFSGVGINGKNSEFHAAMGLCNLKYVDDILTRRREQWSRYNEYLSDLPLIRQKIHDNCEYNCAYYPIVLRTEDEALRLAIGLANQGISTRRYFYPSLSRLSYVKARATPISDSISSRILCLPLYHDLDVNDQISISTAIHRLLGK